MPSKYLVPIDEWDKSNSIRKLLRNTCHINYELSACNFLVYNILPKNTLEIANKSYLWIQDLQLN